jgi:hypothetical protein
VRDHTPWLRAIGALWLVAGTVALLSGVLALLLFAPSSAALPQGTRAFWAQLRVSPWTEIAAIAGGVFALIAGWGLIQRRSWVQTLLVPAHLLSILYAIVGWIAGQALIAQGQVPSAGSAIPWIVPIASVFLILVNAGLLAFMVSVGTDEALSWLPLRTMPLVPLCEFCGGPLDPETQLCPQCDLALVSTDRPPLARLVSLDEHTAVPLSPDQPTRIGRGRSGNDLNLSNPTVSRQHAQIAFRDGQYVLVALRDSNGTFVNDALIREHALQDGDEVRFGRVRFRLEIGRGQDPEAAHA